MCLVVKYMFRISPVLLKDAVKSVLRISSAHNKVGPADINIAQILHLSNFFWIETEFIFIYKHSEPEKC
jgi:hypothetical protein